MLPLESRNLIKTKYYDSREPCESQTLLDLGKAIGKVFHSKALAGVGESRLSGSFTVLAPSLCGYLYQVKTHGVAP
jgi:hypothetical protein